MAGTRALAVWAAAICLMPAGAVAHAGTRVDRCEAAPESVRIIAAGDIQRAGRLRISGGYDGDRVWIEADYRDLRIRKYATKAVAAAQIELHYKGDAVAVSLAGGAVTVKRGRRSIRLDSPRRLEDLQELLAGSGAVFAGRAVLSELERTSSLKGPEMAVLSSLAFVASLVGDTGAPRRLMDRFVEMHRGIFRQVRDDESCWVAYSAELTAAWNDLQSCMQETEDDGFFSGAYQRLACNAVWVMRGVSAEFEYIKCLSPMTGVPKEH